MHLSEGNQYLFLLVAVDLHPICLGMDEDRMKMKRHIGADVYHTQSRLYAILKNKLCVEKDNITPMLDFVIFR